MLLPCSSCARHFRIGEGRCPFCDTPDDRAAPRAAAAAEAADGAARSSSRATRAALVFMGVTALGACGREGGEAAAPVVAAPVDVRPVATPDAGGVKDPSVSQPSPPPSQSSSEPPSEPPGEAETPKPDAGRAQVPPRVPPQRPHTDVVPLYGGPPIDER